MDRQKTKESDPGGKQKYPEGLEKQYCDSLSSQYLSLHGLIYAFSPIVTGLPSTMAVVTVFPRVLATTRVLPDADGVGFSRSISMQSLLPLISTVIAMRGSPSI
jgi:hypothetical protein